MQKFLAVMLGCLLVISNFAYAIDTNVNSIKTTLNNELGLNPASPIFIVTIRRKPNSFPTPLISHSELEQLLKILYSLCANLTTPKYSKGSVILNRAPNTIATAANVTDVNTLCGTLDIYKTTIVSGACMMIVLNEMFFSQERALDISQKNFILEKFKFLSSAAPHTFFYPNFLFTEIRNHTGKQAKIALQKMEISKRSGKMSIRIPNPFRQSQKVVSKIADTVTRQHEYLINETYGIHNKETITTYKKSTYFNESNQKIRSGSIYDFGGGKDIATKVSSNLTNLQPILLGKISTEICFDLANGIRFNNNWTNLREASKLHIIQSNSINPFCRMAPNDNIIRLPIQTSIVHADPYVNQRANTIPYCNSVLGGHRLIGYVNNVNNISHEVDIGDSKYIITICEI